MNAAPDWVVVLYAGSVAFTTYFCMYAFRKPFTAAKFDGLSFLGTQINLKTALVISQIIGYALSKYIGIRLLPEVSRRRRAVALLGFVGLAHGALLLFAVLPSEWKVLAIFLNGLPLGMIWGLVVWFLEGRRTSELLLAALSCSFILASGVVKDVGRWLMSSYSVSEDWMPFTTGLIFLPVYLISVLLLNQLPDPGPRDVAERSPRAVMDRTARRAFLTSTLPFMTMLLAAYFVVTAYRDYRDNYGVEILAGLGLENAAAIFTRIELPVALGVMAVLAMLFLIRDNRRALGTALAMMILGAALLTVASLLHNAGLVGPMGWMILLGLGSYLVYVPYGSILFDRLMASTRMAGTAVFAIYIADAIGYTGSVVVQLYKDLFAGQESRLEFFRSFTYLTSIVAVVLLTGGLVYIMRFTARPAPAGLSTAHAGTAKESS
ncbi:MAG: DUF5690 family protein [Phycisphaerales bacterium]